MFPAGRCGARRPRELPHAPACQANHEGHRGSYRCARNAKDPVDAGRSHSGRGGFRTCDLSRVKQRGASALLAFVPGNQPNRMPQTIIGLCSIRSGTAAFGPTIGPTVQPASCTPRGVCSVNAHAQGSARCVWICPPAPAGEVVRIVVELRRRSRWVDGQTVTGSATS